MPIEGERRTNKKDPSRVAIYSSGQWYELPGASGAVGGGPPKLTEGQSKDVLYGSNAIDADSTLSELEHVGYDPSLVKPGKAALMEQSRLYDAAKQRFTNAVLRKETGASFTEQELKQAESQYFAAPGDSPEVRKYKAGARREFIDNLSKSTGNVFEHTAPDKVFRFKQTATLDGMTPQQIETRRQFRGAKGQVGTRANPYIPRTREEYNNLPNGAYYIASNGQIVVRNRSASPSKPQASGNGWKIISVEDN